MPSTHLSLELHLFKKKGFKRRGGGEDECKQKSATETEGTFCLIEKSTTEGKRFLLSKVSSCLSYEILLIRSFKLTRTMSIQNTFLNRFTEWMFEKTVVGLLLLVMLLFGVAAMLAAGFSPAFSVRRETRNKKNEKQ